MLPNYEFLVVWEVFSQKFGLITKIPIISRFWPQNVTFYCPTMVMNCEKSLLIFTFLMVALHIMLPKGDFLRFIDEE